MKVRLSETLSSGAALVAPILLARLAALRERPDEEHALGALGLSVKVAIRAGETVGDPPDGARIVLQALEGAAAFPVFDGSLRVEPLDAFSCKLALIGSYSVPLGAIGSVADRTILAGAAKRSLRSLLNELRAEVAAAVLRSVGGG